MLKLSRYRLLKLVDSISNHNILAETESSMNSMGELNQEVAYILRALGLSSVTEVRNELEQFKDNEEIL